MPTTKSKGSESHLFVAQPSAPTAEPVIVHTHIGDLKVDHIEPVHRKFARPIVFVPGMWSGSWVFHTLMMDLAKLGHECYALNLRGHCGSKPVKRFGRTTVGDYEADVEQFLSALGRQVDLCGWSMGALIAARVASRHGRVSSLVALAPAPGPWTFLGWPVLSRIPRYLWKMVWGSPVSLTRQHAKDLMFGTFADEEFAPHYERLCPESGWAALGVSLWLYSLKIVEGRKSLVIEGELDRIVRGEESFARNIGAKHDTVPTDHMMMVGKDHLLVAQKIHCFLKSVVREELGQKVI